MNKPDTAAVPATAPCAKQKRPYQPPVLVAFGEVRTLTQGSSQGSVEKNPTGNPPYMS